MSTDLLHTAKATLPDGYPFHIGTRLVLHRDAEGKVVGHHYAPLSEEDFLHPQEEDKFMLADVHAVSVQYLRFALDMACRGRKGYRTFSEHRIDWQIPGIKPHGPDAVVFRDFDYGWDPYLGTLPVKDVGCEVVAVFEVTSGATRHIDFGAKFDEFIEVGIPFYIVVDAAAPNGVPVVMGLRLGKRGFREMRHDSKLGVRVPPLDRWFRWENDRLIVADAQGRDIPDPVELVRELDVEKGRADVEKGRADAEKGRADAEKGRADAEKGRADALAAELSALKARRNGSV